jgi:hypothetical protein
LAHTKSGTQCKLTTCIGTPYCWLHQLSKNHLRVMDSKIKNAGKGLFAMDKSTVDKKERDGRQKAVFRQGQTIVAYGGEKITHQEKHARYRGHTAPYGLGTTHTEDAACKRGIGSIANHKPPSASNSNFVFRNGRWVLVARKRILHGNEITATYGSSQTVGPRYRMHEPGVTHATKKSR